jgi:S-formylglutathione hydrolase
MRIAFAVSVLWAWLFPVACLAGSPRVEVIQIHGNSLESNLEGDAPDRDVVVCLPSHYADAVTRRYPVLYFLPGLLENVKKWFGPDGYWFKLPRLLANADLIAVVPDATTRFGGSMYSTSVTTGDWETFVSREMVGYVDAHYRTIPTPNGRALAGHSMGGYGALRIGMKHPEIFSTVYAMNPCCLGLEFAVPPDEKSAAAMEAIRTWEDLQHADLPTKAAFASAAAWSPDPLRPPFYLDLPWQSGVRQPAVLARWAANRPLVTLDQYVNNLRHLTSLGFDAGDRDAPGIRESVETLHQELNAYAIPHVFTVYRGTHQSAVAQRFRDVLLPFVMSAFKKEEERTHE